MLIVNIIFSTVETPHVTLRLCTLRNLNAANYCCTLLNLNAANYLCTHIDS